MNLIYQQNYQTQNEPGRASLRRAYVTFMIMNDSFLPGALMFAYGLKMQRSTGDIVCMASGNTSKGAVSCLHSLFDKVIVSDEVFVNHQMRHERQDRPFLFSRFNALRLGKDGDLKQNYDKIILCDADLLPIRDYDALFAVNTPAGIINEHKENCVSCDKEGRYIAKGDAKNTGKWHWHEIYEGVCPHGEKIPKDITDRVSHNPNNLGVNASLWVLKPSMVEYESIMEDITREETMAAINKFRWPEMQYATLRWSGQWTNIDLKYSSFNGYPCMEAVSGVHYAGIKPWKYRSIKQLVYFMHFPDYLYWYQLFIKMMNEHNRLFASALLKKIYTEIRETMRMLYETVTKSV